jgi:hypothetical protein
MIITNYPSTFTKFSSKKSQSGVITLVVSLMILGLSTFVTFNVSKAILMEQKITNNDARARQAFEAAEAGILAAISYLGANPDVDGNNSIDPVFDTNSDGLGDSVSSAIGTGSVTVTTTDFSTNMTSIRIVAQGFSDDRSATRTITQTLVTIDPLPNAPDNPVITKGSMIISGSATVHNPEGHSTIWSGDDIDLGSNNSTSTEVPDIGDAGYPDCMDVAMSCNLVEASNRLTPGVDVIENDSSLGNLTADEFFTNFFGTGPVSYRSSMVTIDTTAGNANTDADLATREVVWIEGNTTFSGITTGCTAGVTGNNVCSDANTQPSIIIVNGDVSFSGGNQFYGILFVTGNVSMVGNTTVYGAMVVAGSATSAAGGSLDVWYQSDVLAATSLAGATTGSAGTWKDF